MAKAGFWAEEWYGLFTKLGPQEEVRVCKQEKENRALHCENSEVQGSVQYPSKSSEALCVPNNILQAMGLTFLEGRSDQGTFLLQNLRASHCLQTKSIFL